MNTVWVIVTCAAFLAAIDAGDSEGVDDNAYNDSPSRAKMYGFGGTPQSSGARVKSPGSASPATAQKPSTARGNQGQTRRPGNGGSYWGDAGGLGTQGLGVTGKQKAGSFSRQDTISKSGQKSATGSSNAKLDGTVQNVNAQDDPAQRKKVLQGLAHRVGQNDWRQNLANKQPDDTDAGNYNTLQQNKKSGQENKKRRGSNQQHEVGNFGNNRQHGTKDFGEDGDQKDENDDFGEDDDQQNGINDDFSNDRLQQGDDDFGGTPDDDGPEGPPPPPPSHNNKRPPPPPPPRRGGKNGPQGGMGRGRGDSRDEPDQQQPNGNHRAGSNRQRGGHGDTSPQKHSDGNRAGNHRGGSNPQGGGDDDESPQEQDSDWNQQQPGSHRGGPSGQGGSNNFPQQHSAGRNRRPRGEMQEQNDNDEGPNED